MKKACIVVGAFLLGSGAVMADQQMAVEQANLMKSFGKNMYGTMGRMVKGDVPYDQAAVDAALAQIETDLPKIQKTFAENPKEDVANANFGSSPKIWQDKSGFDSKVPPVEKAVADVKGKIKDLDGLKVAFKSINDSCNSCHETYRVKLK